MNNDPEFLSDEEKPLISLEDLDPDQTFDPAREEYGTPYDPSEDESLDALSADDFNEDGDDLKEELEPDDGDDDDEGEFEYDLEDD